MSTLRGGDLLENIVMEEALSEGKALARKDGFVLFVDGAVPGDVADVEIRYKKKKFAEARLQKLRIPSPDRVEPFCEHFGVCGGCKWQHLSYPAQLAFKQKQVSDALVHLGKLEVKETLPILPSAHTRHYRNRLDFAFSNKRWLTQQEVNIGAPALQPALGFHIPQRFDKVLDIHTCWLQDDLSNRIRNSIKAFAIAEGLSFFDLREQTGLLRNLITRSTSTGEWMAIVVFARNDETAIAQV